MTRRSDIVTLDDYLRHRGWVVTESGCWEANGYRDKGGYVDTCFDGVKSSAHRHAHIAWIGPIPDGMHVNHHCDNPPCINPEHLYAGTVQENMADKVRRGRQARGPANGQTRLTPDEVRAIRADPRPNHVIASDYGSTRSHISQIKRRILWAHLGEGATP